MLRGRISFLAYQPWAQYPTARTTTGKLFGEKPTPLLKIYACI